MQKIKLRVRKLREELGLTQEQLANRVGVRQATISNLETGRASRISFKVLFKLASGLGVGPRDLFE